jgi:hypothetical protein
MSIAFPAQIGRLLCIAVLWSSVTTVAQASIEVPKCPAFVLELELDNAVGAGPRNDKSPAPSAEQRQTRDDSALTQVFYGITQGSSSSGTSTTSAGAGGTGFNAVAVGSIASGFFSDPVITGRLSSERRFTLPLPPGNSLLRPPQSLQCLFG